MDAEITMSSGGKHRLEAIGEWARSASVYAKNIRTLELFRVPGGVSGLGKFHSLPGSGSSHRRYDEAIEKDLALLNLADYRPGPFADEPAIAGNCRVWQRCPTHGQIVPAAKAFLSVLLEARKFVYLYIDGTNSA